MKAVPSGTASASLLIQLLLCRSLSIRVDSLIALLLRNFKSLHAQGDLSVILVEVNDLSLDLLADLKDIRRLVDVSAGDLGDMKQSVNARLKLDERTEIGHACDSSVNDVAGSIFLCSVQPRILLRELQGQGNLGAHDVLNENGDLVTGLEDLLRVSAYFFFPLIVFTTRGKPLRSTIRKFASINQSIAL